MVARLYVNLSNTERLEFALVVGCSVVHFDQFRSVVVPGDVDGLSSFLIAASGVVNALSYVTCISGYYLNVFCLALAVILLFSQEFVHSCDLASRPYKHFR